MKKEEAAKFLGVTVRSIERYTQQGKLGVRYTKGKTRTVANYDKVDLARFKIELDQAIHKPMIENLDNIAHAVSESSELSRLVKEEEAIILSEQLLVLERFSQLLEAFIEYQDRQSAIAPQDKPLLTLAEVQALTGISRKILRSHIDKKWLKSQIIGKAWRVKRTDLDVYLKQLF